MLSAPGPQEHADEERGNGNRAGLAIIEEFLVDVDRPACLQALKALLGEPLTFLRGPIMIDLAIKVEVRWGERVLPHVAHLGPDTMLQARLGDKFLCDFTHRCEVKDDGV